MKNKKGAELAIGTIIVIILALVVLVVLVAGFTMGWGNLWSKITSFGGGKSNIATSVQSCQVACSSNSKADYCKTRNIVGDDGVAVTAKTCKELEGYRNSGLEACAAIPNCQ